MSRNSRARLLGVCGSLACAAGVLIVSPSAAVAEVTSVGVTSFGAADSGSVTASCLRMVGALFFCLGVFAGGVHLYRRCATKAGGLSKRRMVVRERLALSSKSSLVLVSLDGKEFVVASGSENVTLVPTNTITAASFSESLDEESGQDEVFNA